MEATVSPGVNEVRVKLVQAYDGYPVTTKVFTITSVAPCELICYAIRLKYLLLGVPFESLISEDYSSTLVTLRAPLTLEHISSSGARGDAVWDSLRRLYADYLQAHRESDPGERILSELASLVAGLGISPCHVTPDLAKNRPEFGVFSRN